MPTDVTLFNMHEQGILNGMSGQELVDEYDKTFKMEQAVIAYRDLVLHTLNHKDDKEGA